MQLYGSIGCAKSNNYMDSLHEPVNTLVKIWWWPPEDGSCMIQNMSGWSEFYVILMCFLINMCISWLLLVMLLSMHGSTMKQLYLVSIASEWWVDSGNTCFGHHGGHHHVVHTKLETLVQYANSIDTKYSCVDDSFILAFTLWWKTQQECRTSRLCSTELA